MPSERVLHEFMVERRADIVANAVQKMRARAPERDEEDLARGYRAFVDEIVRALQEDAGLPVRSPLPHKSDMAVRHGGYRQRGGDSIGNLAIELGMVSDAVGEVGARADAQFAARDYRILNKCIDVAISDAIEEFSRREGADTSERIGFVVHELRNALQSGRMAFGVMRSGDVGVNGRTGDVLARSLERLQRLIDRLLLAVRASAPREAEIRPTRVVTMLEEVADAAVLERAIRIEVVADPSLVIDADPQLLAAALSNLVQNAIKFTHDDGCVVLRSWARDDDVAIEVEDECGGLPAGKIQELFQPFVQASGDARGLGLGLAITREAIEAQGAAISAHDLPGKGCIFRISGLTSHRTSA